MRRLLPLGAEASFLSLGFDGEGGQSVFAAAYRDAFLPAGFARDQRDARLGDAERLGEKLHEHLIGLSVHGRRSQCDLEFFAVQTDHRGAFRTGLHVKR